MIGWVANALILFGCYTVGNRERVRAAFCCQFAGNAMWAYIGMFRYDGEDRASLIGLSLVLCCLYVRNFIRWGKK